MRTLVAWRSAWHVADEAFRASTDWPYVTLCGVEIPGPEVGRSTMEAAVDKQDTSICRRCARTLP